MITSKTRRHGRPGAAILLLAVMLVLPGPVTASGPVDAGAQANAVIRSFLALCPGYRGPATALADRIAEKQVPARALGPRSPFLSGRAGLAWELSPRLGQAVLVGLDTGVCTIFVRRLEQPAFTISLAAVFARIPLFDLVEVSEAAQTENGLRQRSFAMTPAGDYRAALEAGGRRAGAATLITVSETGRMTAPWHLALSASPRAPD